MIEAMDRTVTGLLGELDAAIAGPATWRTRRARTGPGASRRSAAPWSGRGRRRSWNGTRSATTCGLT